MGETDKWKPVVKLYAGISSPLLDGFDLEVKADEAEHQTLKILDQVVEAPEEQDKKPNWVKNDCNSTRCWIIL